MFYSKQFSLPKIFQWHMSKNFIRNMQRALDNLIFACRVFIGLKDHSILLITLYCGKIFYNMEFNILQMIRLKPI